MGHTRVQPGLRHLPEFRCRYLQGRPEGHQQGSSRTCSAPDRVYDYRRWVGVSLRKEARPRKLLNTLFIFMVRAATMRFQPTTNNVPSNVFDEFMSAPSKEGYLGFENKRVRKIFGSGTVYGSVAPHA